VRRRAFLAAAGLTGLAGCSAGYTPENASAGASPTGLAENGFPSTICEEDPLPGLVRAIDDPAFAADWSGVDLPSAYSGGLTDDRQVVGIAGDDGAYAYPLAVLRRHEVVNDTLGAPLLVTYCPLCRSGMVARREVDGRETTFGVTGLLWKPPDAYTAASETDGTVFVAGEGVDPDSGVRDSGNLVLSDAATESRWSQILARAICGPKRGAEFEILPSSVATWGEWKAEHPATEVLLPPPLSGTL
jgi:hypothetical protein